jgi:hypothetical protein
MNDPKNPTEQVVIPGTDGQATVPTLDDTQLDAISDDMLDQASGGVTSGGGAS